MPRSLLMKNWPMATMLWDSLRVGNSCKLLKYLYIYGNVCNVCKQIMLIVLLQLDTICILTEYIGLAVCNILNN